MNDRKDGDDFAAYTYHDAYDYWMTTFCVYGRLYFDAEARLTHAACIFVTMPHCRNIIRFI